MTETEIDSTITKIEEKVQEVSDELDLIISLNQLNSGVNIISQRVQ